MTSLTLNEQALNPKAYLKKYCRYCTIKLANSASPFKLRPGQFPTKKALENDDMFSQAVSIVFSFYSNEKHNLSFSIKPACWGRDLIW